MDSLEEEFLEGSDDDDNCTVSCEREEELLQDEDSNSNVSRNFGTTQQSQDVFSNDDQEDDILDLELEEEFIEDKLEDVEKPKRQDKFVIERLSKSKSTEKAKPHFNRTHDVASTASQGSRNRVQRGLRKWGGSRGNSRNFPRNNSGYNREGRTIFINPSYQGSVQVNDNARLAWDNQTNSNQNVQPWASSQLPSQQILTGLMGLVSNFQHSNLLPVQEDRSIFQPPSPQSSSGFHPSFLNFQSNFHSPPPQPNFNLPPPQPNFHPPPAQHSFHSPPAQHNFHSPPPEHNFHSPPPEHNFHSPPPQLNFHSPPPELYFKPPLQNQPPPMMFSSPPPTYYSQWDGGSYHEATNVSSYYQVEQHVSLEEQIVFPPITTVPPPPLVPRPLFAPYRAPEETTKCSTGSEFNTNPYPGNDLYKNGSYNRYNKNPSYGHKDNREQCNQTFQQQEDNRSFSSRNNREIRTNFKKNQQSNNQFRKKPYDSPNNNRPAPVVKLTANCKLFPPSMGMRQSKSQETCLVSPKPESVNNKSTFEAPDEQEDEETKIYRMKIEQQKREREQVWKMKEERRWQQNASLKKFNNPKFPIANLTLQTIKTLFNTNQKKESKNSNNISLVSPKGPKGPMPMTLPTIVVTTKDDLLVNFKINVSNPQAIKTVAPETAPPSGFMTNRRFVKGCSKSTVSPTSTFTTIATNAVRGAGNGDGDDDSGKNLSSFFNSRTILSKDPSLLHTRIVVVSNLSASTREDKLINLAEGIGEIQKLQFSRQERQATILFKNVASAHTFYKRYRRHMVDLSMMDVRLEPMI